MRSMYYSNVIAHDIYIYIYIYIYYFNNYSTFINTQYRIHCRFISSIQNNRDAVSSV